MSVIRVHKNKNFTVMSNAHLRDMDLSLKAKGLLSVMLSLPDNWNYSIAGLCSICKENETAIKSTIKELKERHYVIVDKKYPNQTESKKYEYVYNIFEEPQPENQEVDYQDIENLPLDNLPIGNQSLNKRTDIKNIDKSNTDKINVNSKANSFFAKKVVNQDEFINHIHNVVKKLEEEVFDEYQADNVEQFFIYFVERYTQVFGKRHPFLKEETLYSLAADITEHIYIDRGEFYTNFEPLVSDEPEDNSYESVVDLYFETEFKEKCDYSMVHFCQKNVLTKLMGHDSSHLWFTNES